MSCSSGKLSCPMMSRVHREASSVSFAMTFSSCRLFSSTVIVKKPVFFSSSSVNFVAFRCVLGNPHNTFMVASRAGHDEVKEDQKERHMVEPLSQDREQLHANESHEGSNVWFFSLGWKQLTSLSFDRIIFYS